MAAAGPFGDSTVACFDAAGRTVWQRSYAATKALAAVGEGDLLIVTNTQLARSDPAGFARFSRPHGLKGPLAIEVAKDRALVTGDDNGLPWAVRIDLWGNSSCDTAGCDTVLALCSDGKACTWDWCESGQCKSAAAPDGQECDAGGCGLDDACTSGACKLGQKPRFFAASFDVNIDRDVGLLEMEGQPMLAYKGQTNGAAISMRRVGEDGALGGFVSSDSGGVSDLVAVVRRPGGGGWLIGSGPGRVCERRADGSKAGGCLTVFDGVRDGAWRPGTSSELFLVGTDTDNGKTFARITGQGVKVEKIQVGNHTSGRAITVHPTGELSVLFNVKPPVGDSQGWIVRLGKDTSLQGKARIDHMKDARYADTLGEDVVVASGSNELWRIGANGGTRWKVKLPADPGFLRVLGDRIVATGGDNTKPGFVMGVHQGGGLLFSRSFGGVNESIHDVLELGGGDLLLAGRTYNTTKKQSEPWVLRVDSEGRAQCELASCAGLAQGGCDDGNACTIDRCEPGKGCTSAALAKDACADGESCTTEVCDPKTGCLWTAVKDGTSCSKSLCWAAGSCKSGRCEPAKPGLWTASLGDRFVYSSWQKMEGALLVTGDAQVVAAFAEKAQPGARIDPALRVLDKHGAVVRTGKLSPKSAKSSEHRIPRAMAQLGSGEVVIVGEHRDGNAGKALWIKAGLAAKEGHSERLDLPAATYRDVIATGNEAIVAGSEKARSDNAVSLVRRLNSEGQQVWRWDGPTESPGDELWGLTSSGADVVAVGGAVNHTLGQAYFHAVKVSQDKGKLLWSHTWQGASGGGTLFSVARGSDGGLFGAGLANKQAIVVRLEDKGSTVQPAWEKVLSSSNTGAFDIQPMGDELLVAVPSARRVHRLDVGGVGLASLDVDVAVAGPVAAMDGGDGKIVTMGTNSAALTVARVDVWGHRGCDQARGCAGKKAADCDDGNACTWDVCDPVDGCKSARIDGCSLPTTQDWDHDGVRNSKDVCPTVWNPDGDKGGCAVFDGTGWAQSKALALTVSGEKPGESAFQRTHEVVEVPISAATLSGAQQDLADVRLTEDGHLAHFEVVGDGQLSVSDPSIVAWWPFDGDFEEKKSKTVAVEKGDVIFVADRAGQSDGAASFDGKSYLESNVGLDAIGPNDPLTIEVHFKCQPGPNGNVLSVEEGGFAMSLAVGKKSSGDRGTGIEFGSATVSNDFVYADGDGCNGKWRHLAFTRSGSACRIWLDGTVVTAGTCKVSAPLPDKASAPYIGARRRGGTDRFVKGQLDDLVVHKVARDSAYMAARAALSSTLRLRFLASTYEKPENTGKWRLRDYKLWWGNKAAKAHKPRIVALDGKAECDHLLEHCLGYAGWWRMEALTMGRVVDSTHMAVAAVLPSAGKLVAGPAGMALQLTGSGPAVVTSQPHLDLQHGTFEALAAIGNPVGQQSLLSKGTAPASYLVHMSLSPNPGTVWIGEGKTDEPQGAVANKVAVGKDQWQRWAGVWSDRRLTLYRDGAVLATTAHPGLIVPQKGAALLIGGSSEGSSAGAMVGAIDEVRLMTRPLQPDELLRSPPIVGSLP